MLVTICLGIIDLARSSEPRLRCQRYIWKDSAFTVPVGCCSSKTTSRPATLLYLHGQTEEEMKFSGTWSEPVLQRPEAAPSPLFLRLEELNRLGDIVAKAASVRAETFAKQSLLGEDGEQVEDSLGSWLVQLKAEIELDGFDRVFVSDEECIALVLAAFGVDSKPSAKALNDPYGVSIEIFKKLFAAAKSTQSKVVVQALEKGVIDRMLLRLGELQAEKPCRPARAERFVIGPTKKSPSRETTTVTSTDTTSSTAKPSSSGSTSEVNPDSNTVSSNVLPSSLATALWKPGYGTGEASASTSKHDAEREAQRAEKSRRTKALAECLILYLDSIQEPEEEEGSNAFWKDLLDCLEASCLLKVMMSSFYDVTCKAVVENVELYTALLRLVEAVARRKPLAPLVGKVPDVYKPLCELMRYMKELALRDLVDEDDDVSKRLLKLIENTYEITEAAELHRVESQRRQQQVQEHSKSSTSPNAEEEKAKAAASEAEAESKAYEDAMRGELFKDIDMRDPTTGKYAFHHFSSAIDEDGKETGASKNRQRRLNRELKSLRTTLPLYFGSTIVLRIDRTRPFVGQFIIFAPQNTPYDSGAFLFDFFCSADYPNEPPKVNLQTTGQGKVRFNPNLYQNGKVCLSLLGTWRGGATGSENWSAENSSLYQVLVSIQSAILGSEFPYFNEPTVEALWGTEEGELQKRIHPNGGYERLRVATIQYAMTAQIRQPPTGFEQCIRTHFLHKRRYLRAVCSRWIAEAETSNTTGHLQALKEAVEELEVALKDLGPTPQEALFGSSQISESAEQLRNDEQAKLEGAIADQMTTTTMTMKAKLEGASADQMTTTTLTTKTADAQKLPSSIAFLSDLKLSEAAIAGMSQQVIFIREVFPDLPEDVFIEAFKTTAKRDSLGEIAAIDFTAALEKLSKLAK